MHRESYTSTAHNRDFNSISSKLLKLIGSSIESFEYFRAEISNL